MSNVKESWGDRKPPVGFGSWMEFDSALDQTRRRVIERLVADGVRLSVVKALFRDEHEARHLYGSQLMAELNAWEQRRQRRGSSGGR